MISFTLRLIFVPLPEMIKLGYVQACASACVLQGLCELNDASENASITLQLYSGISYIKILDEFDVDLCVTVLTLLTFKTSFCVRTLCECAITLQEIPVSLHNPTGMCPYQNVKQLRFDVDLVPHF